MAFCKNGGKKIADFLKKIDAIETTLIEDVTTITGKIKAYEGNPTVEFLVGLIPNGSTYEQWFNAAIDRINPALKEIQSVTEKIQKFFEGASNDAKDMQAFKLASIAVAEADGNKQTQSFYDTAVQTHIEDLK